MPRPKDHRDVTVNTLVISTPRRRLWQYNVHFESQTDLPRSSIARETSFTSAEDSSTHRVSLVIVDGSGNLQDIGAVSWKRLIQCWPDPSMPHLQNPVDLVDPQSGGLPALPSRAPDATMSHAAIAGVHCEVETWADAAQGYSATITTSLDLHTIRFRDLTTGTNFVCTLSAEMLDGIVLPSVADSPMQAEPDES